MITRTACDVEAVGLTPDQIKAIQLKVVLVGYVKRKGVFKCKNFEVADKVRRLRRVYMLQNIHGTQA